MYRLISIHILLKLIEMQFETDRKLKIKIGVEKY